MQVRLCDLSQSQYTDTGPTSPNADPITPGDWQGGHLRTSVIPLVLAVMQRKEGEGEREREIERERERLLKKREARGRVRGRREES